jgi:hypothetical protein
MKQAQPDGFLVVDSIELSSRRKARLRFSAAACVTFKIASSRRFKRRSARSA